MSTPTSQRRLRVPPAAARSPRLASSVRSASLSKRHSASNREGAATDVAAPFRWLANAVVPAKARRLHQRWRPSPTVIPAKAGIHGYGTLLTGCTAVHEFPLSRE